MTEYLETLQWRNVLIFLFVFFLPTQLGKHFFLPFSHIFGVRVDYLAPTIYVTDILAFALIVAYLPEYRSMLRNKTIQWILLLLSLTIIFAYSRDFGIYKFIKVIELFAIAGIFLSKRINKITVFKAFFFGALLQLCIASLQLMMGRSLGGEFYFIGERPLGLSMPGIAKATFDGIEILRPYGTFSHPNSLAGFFLLLYSYYLFHRPLVSQWVYWIFIIICASLTVISFSKIAIGTLFFITLLYLIGLNKMNSNRPLRRVVIITLLFVCTLFFQASTDPLTVVKRVDLISDAASIIAANPITGVGLGNYLYAQADFPQKYPSFIMQPVHNIGLLIIAEVGIPITLFLVYSLINRMRPIARGVHIIPFIAVFITGMFDHYWLTLQQNWLLLGVLWGITMWRPISRHSPDSVSVIPETQNARLEELTR